MNTSFTRDHIVNDRHGATYVAELDRLPQAASELFSILSDHDNAVRLETASELGLSALSGLATRIEGSPAISEVLSGGDGSARFRQAVGVAVRIKMEALGWRTTGSKGVVVNAEHFGKAERYVLSAGGPK